MRPISPASVRDARRLVRAVAAVAAVGVVALLSVLAAAGWGLAGSVAYSVLAVVGLLVLAASARRQPAGRMPWVLLAVGAAVLVSGQLSLMWLVDDYAPERTPEVWLSGLAERPGAFAVGLVAYPLLLAGQLVLLRQRVSRILPSSWLDVLAAASLLAAASWAFLVPAAGRTLGLEPLGAVLLTARPLLDLLLVALAASTWGLSGWRADRRLPMLVLAFAVLAISDTAGALHVAGVVGGPVVGAGVDVGRLVALGVAAAAAATRASRPSDARVDTLGAVVTSVLALVLCVALLALDQVRPLRPTAVGLVLLTLLLVGAKLLVVIREVVRLAGSRQQALTDDLTGLANRRAFDGALAAAGDGRRAGLLLVDLDRFKEVNDRHGHAAGDALLRRTSTALRDVVPRTAPVARLGGDEFAVLLPGADVGAASEAARAVVAAVGAASVAGAGPDAGGPAVGASVGVATTPDASGRSVAAEELLRRADAAMFVAKRAGRGDAPDGGGPRDGASGAWGVYDEAADAERRERRETLEGLRAVLSGAAGAGELVVHYQPQVAASGVVVGAEALVRWRHPDRGLLAPAAFLDLAEEHGLMGALTARVLRRAAADAAGWARRGHRLRVSVNVSTSVLVDPGLMPLVEEVLARTPLAASDLVLEITETMLMRDPERALPTARRLAERGVGLSIDDYGTGYASMGYLDDLPATELKLDRAFTARLGRRERTAAIVRTTVDLAHRLGLRLVAEGVEDHATLRALHDLGVDETQGYLHSRPLDAAAFGCWLDERTTSAPGPSSGSTDDAVALGAAQTSSR
ncbi:bifunctional diguanylate cyclase/phosphodiesterase [uncultured Pseudokineococcus sp.]|uniref:putative bifunctional diguanylate cyclase/phosphodiesterase n=1 Tax=uncultured Pseudokineococcus sp. TaxID=1642928 RepID=UPI0026296C68|nr:bifunctional diguanylate cyclase/phosphodiesterase [uncultured Pseudokineococcus sp.]